MAVHYFVTIRAGALIVPILVACFLRRIVGLAMHPHPVVIAAPVCGTEFIAYGSFSIHEKTHQTP
jgi:hypothetical protein